MQNVPRNLFPIVHHHSPKADRTAVTAQRNWLFSDTCHHVGASVPLSTRKRFELTSFIQLSALGIGLPIAFSLLIAE